MKQSGPLKGKKITKKARNFDSCQPKRNVQSDVNQYFLQMNYPPHSTVVFNVDKTLSSGGEYKLKEAWDI